VVKITGGRFKYEEANGNNIKKVTEKYVMNIYNELTVSEE
jgi:hypothetical protein